MGVSHDPRGELQISEYASLLPLHGLAATMFKRILTDNQLDTVGVSAPPTHLLKKTNYPHGDHSTTHLCIGKHQTATLALCEFADASYKCLVR